MEPGPGNPPYPLKITPLHPVKFYPKPVLLLPLLLLAAGCASDDDKEVPHAIGRTVTRTQGDAAMYTVKDDDMQLEHATRHARRTVGEFITALRSPQPGQHDFLVKKLFISKDGHAEHIWLADVKFTGNRFVGSVDNKPNAIPGLKVGAQASVNPDEITDWSYVDNGKLVGGYTIRVLYAEMSPEERQDFEKRAEFHIAP